MEELTDTLNLAASGLIPIWLPNNIASGSLDARPPVSDSSCLDPSGFNRLSHGSISALESITATGTWPPTLLKGGGLLATHVTPSLLLLSAVVAADADAGDLAICDAAADANAGSTTNMLGAIVDAIVGADAGAGAGAGAADDAWTGCLC